MRSDWLNGVSRPVMWLALGVTMLTASNSTYAADYDPQATYDWQGLYIGAFGGTGDVDNDGFVFYTNYRSAKGRDLEANPQAALVFYWSQFDRQVRVEGTVERVSTEESQAYFKTRPRESQIGAWASPQSKEISSREELDQRVAELERRFQDGPIPCPPNWGGFLLRPVSIEFWQGRENRLHDRIVYTLQTDGSWRISQLAP